jgi:hypothetical protein
MITKDFFYVGKDSTKSNYSTFPNQLINCFDYFTHTELKLILFFQSCPPAQRFNISAISKKVGGNWKRTNDAISKLIAEKTIVVKTTNEGHNRYCIDFTVIIERGQQNKTAINLEESALNETENQTETTKISFSTQQVEYGVQTTTNITTSNAASEKNTVSSTEEIESVEPINLGVFFEDENTGVTEKQILLQSKPVTPSVVELSPKHPYNYESQFFTNIGHKEMLINNFNYFKSLKEENKKCTKILFEIILVNAFVKCDTVYMPNLKEHNNKEFVQIFNYQKDKREYCETISNLLPKITEEHFEFFDNETKKYQLS